MFYTTIYLAVRLQDWVLTSTSSKIYASLHRKQMPIYKLVRPEIKLSIKKHLVPTYTKKNYSD